MKITKQQVINLPVYTLNKKYLGKVIEIEKDPLSDEVVLFYVQAHSLVTKLLKGTEQLIISEEQVVSINKERMVVKDLTDREIVSTQEFFKNKLGSPALSSELD